MRLVSLFDESGNMVRPWAKAGWQCYCFDLLNEGKPRETFPSGGTIFYVAADLLDKEWQTAIIELEPKFVFGFPPCTDLAVSGSRHFSSKEHANLFFQAEATVLVRVVETIGEACQCPWFAENPVSTLATWWRSPDFTFDPYEYGGYLPEDDIHPRWPEYINPRDAYPKKTCLWTGGGLQLPPKSPVSVPLGWSKQMRKLGGKSAKTKQIRAETPRGFAKALFELYNG